MMKPLEYALTVTSEFVDTLELVYMLCISDPSSLSAVLLCVYALHGVSLCVVLVCRCPYLHRNAGDTERRYHLRYYKTSTCVYETDARGFCVKNGPHCAFAHGPGDLRQPVYDRRELQGEDDDRVSLLTTLERDKGVLVDDPRWQGRGCPVHT